MKASELIKQLQDIVEQSGDLSIKYFINDNFGGYTQGYLTQMRVVQGEKHQWIELNDNQL